MEHRISPLAVCLLAMALAVVAVQAAAGASPATSDSSVPSGAVQTRALLDPSRFAELTSAVDARVGLDRRLARDTSSGLGTACVVVGLPAGESLFDLGGDASLIPASTTKLFTGLAALAVLGPEARFSTEVWEKDGTLYLKGGGDPVLATPNWVRDHPGTAATSLADLANRASEAHPGSRRVVADAGALDVDPGVDGWESRYVRDLTAPRISALAVDRGRPASQPGWPKVPDGQGDADLAAAAAFAGLYGGGGGGMAVERGATPAGATLIASIESPSLAEVLAAMEKNSDNFIAEVLLRQVGRSKGDPTTAGGVRAETEVLSAMGVDLSGVRLEDGSGLHRGSRVSCRSFLGLLQSGLSDASIGPVFAGSLALGGTDGTLKKRDLADGVRAKTGTLNDVSNLVGAAPSEQGDLYFAILMNDVSQTERARQVQDRIVGDIAAWPRP